MEKQINSDFDAIKEAVDKEYRTDHLTLPNVPPYQDLEVDKISAIEREMILNPDLDENTVIAKDGTTLKEWRNMQRFGIPPKGYTKPEKAKHTFETEMVDGVKKVVVVAPESAQPKEESMKVEELPKSMMITEVKKEPLPEGAKDNNPENPKDKN